MSDMSIATLSRKPNLNPTPPPIVDLGDVELLLDYVARTGKTLDQNVLQTLLPAIRKGPTAWDDDDDRLGSENRRHVGRAAKQRASRYAAECYADPRTEHALARPSTVQSLHEQHP